MLNVQDELEKLGRGWSVENGNTLVKTYEFKGFLKTMSFVNAVAWLANKVMHHPDMEVSFSKCKIKLTTHDEGYALTVKDFELANLIENL